MGNPHALNIVHKAAKLDNLKNSFLNEMDHGLTASFTASKSCMTLFSWYSHLFLRMTTTLYSPMPIYVHTVGTPSPSSSSESSPSMFTRTISSSSLSFCLTITTILSLPHLRYLEQLFLVRLPQPRLSFLQQPLMVHLPLIHHSYLQLQQPVSTPLQR
jgi:hypothetical protein